MAYIVVTCSYLYLIIFILGLYIPMINAFKFHINDNGSTTS